MKVLNITNGEYFNRYFISKFGGEAVPFNEDFMDGRTVTNIYSEKFISLRANELNVSVAEYRSNMQAYDALKTKEYDRLRLWFGKDTFCQMNLLALLAYLEQIRFSGRILLNYIDDETFALIDADIEVELGPYRTLYEQILIFKRCPNSLGVLVRSAIDLYFDYLSPNGSLANLVKANGHMDKTALVCLLIESAAAYGLSDLQAERLIRAHSVNG